MSTQQSGSDPLLEVRINASRVSFAEHEKVLFKRQKQLLKTLQYLRSDPTLLLNQQERQIAKAICCARVLVQVDDDLSTPDIGDKPSQGRFRWAYACRQLQWCSRCAAIERDSRARRFGKSVAKHAKGQALWGVVISPDRPETVSEMMNSAQLVQGLLTGFSKGFVRSKKLGTSIYLCGMHTQPQPGGTLWPHLHTLITSPADVSKKRVVNSARQWVRNQGITGFTVTGKYLGTVGQDKHEEDLKRLYQYITRHDDSEDGLYHPTVRHAVQSAIGQKRNYRMSTLPATVKLKRRGFPNASTPRKWLRMLWAKYDHAGVQFDRTDLKTPIAAANQLYRECTETLGIIDE